MRAIIETRGIRTGSSKYTRPSKYVAIQLVPDGVEPLTALRSDVAAKRGIQIIHCGEYYWNSLGPRSMYAKAMAKAEAIVAEHNGK